MGDDRFEILKGLKGLKGLEELKKGIYALSDEDREFWINNNKHRLPDASKVPPIRYYEMADRIYKNDLFRGTFQNEELFMSLTPAERDTLYNSTLDKERETRVNSAIKDYYGNDEEFSTINNMTLEGKIALLESGYLNSSDFDSYTDTFKNTAEDIRESSGWERIMWEQSEIGPDYHDHTFSGKTTIESAASNFEDHIKVAENKRQNQLREIKEEDNIAKVSNTSALAERYKNTWNEAIKVGKISEHEIEELFNEYIGNYSNYYKAFKNSEELENFSFSNKLDFLSKFMGVYNSYGAESAVEAMDTEMQNYISDNQDWWDWACNTGKQILTKGVANLANKITALEAMGRASYDLVTGSHSLERFLNEGENVLLDPLYWQGVDQYNTFDANAINLARKNGGLSPYQNITKAGEEMEFLSWKTVNDAAGQLGYVWSEMAASRLTGAVGKGLGKVSPAFTSSFAKGLGTTIDIGQSVAGMSFSEGLSSYQETVNQANERINAQIEIDAMEYVQQQASTDEFKAAVNNKVTELEDYYNNKGISKTQEDIFSEASSLVSQELVEQYKVDTADKYEEARAEAMNAGVKAYMTTASIFAVKEAATNTLFQRWLYNKGTRQALGDNGPKLDIVNNANGTVSASISRWNKYAKPFVSNAATEFFEEVTDNMVNNFGQGFGLNGFNNYFDKKYNPEAYVEAYDNIFGSIMSGWTKTKESLTTIDPYYEGFIGAISGVGGGTVDVYRNIKRDKNLPKEVKLINDILKKHGNSIQDVVTAFNLLHDVDVAIAEGDMMGAIDAKQRQAFALVQTLNELGSSEVGRQSTFYQNTMQTLQSLADGTIKEEQLNELVTQFLGQGKNKSIADSSTAREDAVKALTENAKELLSIKQSVDEVNAVLDKSPDRGLISPGVREELVYLKVMGKNWQDRLNSIEKSLGNSKPSNNFNPNAAYGSTSALRNKENQVIEEKQKVEDYIEKTEDLISNIEKEDTNSKEEKTVKKNIIRALKLRRNYLKEQLKKYKQQIKDMSKYENIFNDEGYAKTLSKEEILALPAAQRAEMLDPKNLSNYSQEQQLIIEETKAALTAKNPSLIKSVEDAGVLSQRIAEIDKVFSRIVNHPEDANAYMLEMKKQNIFKAEELYKEKKATEKAQQLSIITDYTEFSKEMDAVFNEGSTKEQQVISKYLKDLNNPLYNKYVEEKNKIGKVLNYVAESREFNALSDNDADMFINTLSYLNEQGISLSDKNAIIQALSKKDKDGNLEFEKYVERVNKGLSSDEKVVFTSIGEAIYNFNNVMEDYLKAEAEKEDNNAPIVVDYNEDNTPVVETNTNETTEEKQEEKKKEEDKKVVFPGYTTPEGGFTQEEREIAQSISDNPIVQAFAAISGVNVAEAVQNMLNIIKNIPRFNSNVKAEATRCIENLKDTMFENVEELIDNIIAIANTRDSQNESGNDETANLLRTVAAKIEKNVVQDKSDVQKRRSVFFERKRKQLDTTTQKINSTYNMYPNSTSNSSFIASINIDQVRITYPDSPIVKYYEDHRIDEAILNGILEKSPKVYFITDENLTATNEQLSNYNAEVSLPIVAVVESENGTISIDGKKYQPIGVMAATNKESSAGSTHMAPIRKLALKNKGTQLVKREDGTAVVTTLYGTPMAYPVDKNYRGSNSVVSIGLNDLSAQDRAQAVDTDGNPKRNSFGYAKMKSNFLKRVEPISQDSRKGLFYMQPTLNGGTNSIEIFILPIHETLSRDGKYTFEEVASLNGSEIIDFNSRTSRAAKSLESFIELFKTEDLLFIPQGEAVIPTEGAKIALNEMASRLRNSIGNFINIPGNWQYTIEPTNEVKNGKIVMQVSIASNDGTTIPLTTIYEGMSKEDITEAQVSLIKNLILDENGKVRMVNAGQDSFAKWNVPYNDFNNSNKNATENVSDIYDDDILTAAATTFNYRIQGFAVKNPFKSDGSPSYVEVANPDNANDNALPKGQVHTEGGAVVDSNINVVIEGKATPATNAAHKHAQEIVRTIEEDSRNYELSEDETVYIDKRTGERYARVTSIISADKHGDRMDANNPYVTPSTNIGTGVDTLVRDFFAGTIKHDSNGYYLTDGKGNRVELETVYPNANKWQLQTFCKDLQQLHNYFTSNGITIVPKDVMAVGNIEILDNKGEIQKIKVAGTLDLLAYDSEGNFIILDMKSHLSKTIDDGRKSKWARQLSLYKELLEAKYGIKVKGLRIIPIKVNYPTPNRNNVYDTSNSKNNQLTLNGKEFQDSNPRVEPIISLNFTSLQLVWDKLTEQEKTMAESINSVRQEQHPEIETTPDAIQVSGPTEVHKDGILGGNYIQSNTLEEMFGLDPIEGEVSIEVSEKPANIPDNMKWENLTEEQKDILGLMGYNKNNWTDLTQEEMEHELKCID